MQSVFVPQITTSLLPSSITPPHPTDIVRRTPTPLDTPTPVPNSAHTSHFPGDIPTSLKPIRSRTLSSSSARPFIHRQERSPAMSHRTSSKMVLPRGIDPAIDSLDIDVSCDRTERERLTQEESIVRNMEDMEQRKMRGRRLMAARVESDHGTDRSDTETDLEGEEDGGDYSLKIGLEHGQGGGIDNASDDGEFSLTYNDFSHRIERQRQVPMNDAEYPDDAPSRRISPGLMRQNLTGMTSTPAPARVSASRSISNSGAASNFSPLASDLKKDLARLKNASKAFQLDDSKLSGDGAPTPQGNNQGAMRKAFADIGNTGVVGARTSATSPSKRSPSKLNRTGGGGGGHSITSSTPARPEYVRTSTQLPPSSTNSHVQRSSAVAGGGHAQSASVSTFTSTGSDGRPIPIRPFALSSLASVAQPPAPPNSANTWTGTGGTPSYQLGSRVPDGPKSAPLIGRNPFNLPGSTQSRNYSGSGGPTTTISSGSGSGASGLPAAPNKTRASSSSQSQPEFSNDLTPKANRNQGRLNPTFSKYDHHADFTRLSAVREQHEPETEEEREEEGSGRGEDERDGEQYVSGFGHRYGGGLGGLTRLPDITGLTEGLLSPEKIRGHRKFSPTGFGGGRVSPPKNGVGQVQEGGPLFNELAQLRERLRAVEDANDRSAARIKELESKLAKEKNEGALGADEGQGQQRTVWRDELDEERESRKALESLVNRLRGHVSQLTKNLSPHARELERLNDFAQSSSERERMYADEAQGLRHEIDGVRVEVGVWRGEVSLLKDGLDGLSKEVVEVKDLVEGLMQARERLLSEAKENAIRREREASVNGSEIRSHHQHGDRDRDIQSRFNEEANAMREMSNEGRGWKRPETPRSGRSFIEPEEIERLRSEIVERNPSRSCSPAAVAVPGHQGAGQQASRANARNGQLHPSHADAVRQRSTTTGGSRSQYQGVVAGDYGHGQAHAEPSVPRASATGRSNPVRTVSPSPATYEDQRTSNDPLSNSLGREMKRAEEIIRTVPTTHDGDTCTVCRKKKRGGRDKDQPFSAPPKFPAVLEHVHGGGTRTQRSNRVGSPHQRRGRRPSDSDDYHDDDDDEGYGGEEEDDVPAANVNVDRNRRANSPRDRQGRRSPTGAGAGAGVGAGAGRRSEGGRGKQEELPPQIILARELRDLEDDFGHHRAIYIELSESYKKMDPAANLNKRTALASHLKESIDTLELKAQEIHRLYSLLHAVQPGDSR